MQALEPHASALSQLRRKIERLGTTSSERRTLAFGIEAIDRALPGGGLALGAVHEITEQGADGAAPRSRRCSRPASSRACRDLSSGACTAAICSRRLWRASVCILTA
jgi:hypothetical protein